MRIKADHLEEFFKGVCDKHRASLAIAYDGHKKKFTVLARNHDPNLVSVGSGESIIEACDLACEGIPQ
jgi:hypothetical protein